MSIKKSIQWVVMFSALLAFTGYTLGNVAGWHTKAAMAKALEEDEMLLGSFKVILVRDNGDDKKQNDDDNDGDDDDDGNNNNGGSQSKKGFLKKFARAYEREMICGVNETQYNALSLLYDTAQDNVSVKGKDVPVITVTQENGLKAKDLERIVETSDGEQPRCQVLKHSKLFYLLFTAHVS